jgi:hypothetical protein
MQNISSNCKLKSEYFNLRIKNHKKFRINCRKDAIKSLEFICEILETMQNASKCEPESLKNLE